MQTAIKTAQTMLVNLLSCGPVASAAVRAKSDAAGIAWRTTERAAATIGVEKLKVGKAWAWKLPGTSSPPKPPTEADALSRNVVAFERPIASPGTKAEAKPKPADRPRVHWGPPLERIWARGAPLVRCGDCIHLVDVSADGHCPASGMEGLRWAYARRHCDAFKDDRPTGARIRG